ncbi:MAG TPA: multicopper oxidase domain-containing protein, partial [Gemmatimonadales bacterium]|nr:multicopper oxidase domain-containing protein [Gemmatimonadales bacterium]
QEMSRRGELIGAAALALALACRGPAPAAPPRETPAADRPAAQAAPNLSPTSPSELSHGEATVGTGGTEPRIEPDAPAPAPEKVKRIRLEMRHRTITIAPNVRYAAWTFGDRVPGPAMRVTVGDTIDFTLVNAAPIPHSLDFHAAEVAPSRVYTNVNPGDSISYRWVARVPGAFMYHCGTAPVAQHIANGMYGAIIVDPHRPLPRAREFVFVQSEFYGQKADTGGTLLGLDWQKLLGLAPDYVVFNGHANEYAAHPLQVHPGELLRMYVVNAGPNRISSFHVVGAIFERVYVDGVLGRPLQGVQTVDVPVGGGAIFELRLAEPGTYPFVTHAFADATKGGVGMLRARAPGDTAGAGPVAGH